MTSINTQALALQKKLQEQHDTMTSTNFWSFAEKPSPPSKIYSDRKPVQEAREKLDAWQDSLTDNHMKLRVKPTTPWLITGIRFTQDDGEFELYDTGITEVVEARYMTHSARDGKEALKAYLTKFPETVKQFGSLIIHRLGE
jgi:hypothetical protein